MVAPAQSRPTTPLFVLFDPTGREREPITILLVDRDDTARQQMRQTISASRVCNQVRELESGVEALEFLTRRAAGSTPAPPALVLLDAGIAAAPGCDDMGNLLADLPMRGGCVLLFAERVGTGGSDLPPVTTASTSVPRPASGDEFLRMILLRTNFSLRASSPPINLPDEDLSRRVPDVCAWHGFAPWQRQL